MIQAIRTFEKLITKYKGMEYRIKENIREIHVLLVVAIS